MEQTQNHTGMVFYNYNTVDGIFSGAPVQVEIGSQPVQIQYGSYSTVSSLPSQSQHVIVAHQPAQEVSVDALETQISKAPKQKTKSVSIGVRVPCPQCGKTFSCNANLRDHLRLHTGERPFTCSECGMSFAQRSNWRLHKRVHTGERPYMCGICGKTFARSSHLPGHMRVHTGERPFQCDSCEHTFASAQALKNHIRTHTGEKPFVCDYCHTPFTHSSSLSSHKKRCNGEKRKRGRPLGSGRRSFMKKKTPAGRRGRPKKRGKLAKKGRKKLKTEVKNDCESLKNEETDPLNIENEINETSSVIKFEPQTLNSNDKTLSIEENVMEISVEVINDISPPEKEENTVIDHEMIKRDENETISILPHGDEFIMAADVVQAAATAAGLTTTSDLHQEAAVTMATLQHGALNLVHHNGSIASDEGGSTTFYEKLTDN